MIKPERRLTMYVYEKYATTLTHYGRSSHGIVPTT